MDTSKNSEAGKALNRVLTDNIDSLSLDILKDDLDTHLPRMNQVCVMLSGVRECSLALKETWQAQVSKSSGQWYESFL